MQTNSVQLSFCSTEGAQEIIAKPFLKWAGGKTQLLEQIARYFTPELKTGNIQR